jgi:hypothetical protein
MRLNHKAVSLFLPCVEVYLSRSKRSMGFDFCEGVAELVFCGGAAFFSLWIRIPPMLPRAPLARPFFVLPLSHPFLESFFRVTHFDRRSNSGKASGAGVYYQALRFLNRLPAQLGGFDGLPLFASEEGPPCGNGGKKQAGCKGYRGSPRR